MALTPENIAKINEMIADFPNMTGLEFAGKHFPESKDTKSSRHQLTCAFASAMRFAGVELPMKGRFGAITAHELSQFRAWKARQNQDQDTVA